MEAPYTIASLPKPLDKVHGRTYAAPVHALKATKKRKRHEVAATVDGESVNIYNVHTQSLVASYPVPPQTYFCSRPCSIFCRATTQTSAQRVTYAVIRDGPKSRSRKLLCFTENVRSRKGVDEGFAAPKKSECSIPDGDICSLDTVATAAGEVAAGEVAAVVVAYKDGRVLSVESDLAKVHEARPEFADTSSREIEFSELLHMETAKKALLRNRGDVLAALDQTAAGGFRGTLICEVERNHGHRRLELCVLTGHAQNRLQAGRSGLQSIVGFPLPTLDGKSAQRGEHDIHATSGKLYSLLDGKLIVYDLGGIVPRVSAELGGPTDPVLSFARLSTSMLVATTAATTNIYETTYGSLQATVSLPSPSTRSADTKKRKRDSLSTAAAEPAATVVSVYSELGLLVHLSDNQLTAVQLGEGILALTHKKERGALLSDVLSGEQVRSEKGGEESSEWNAKVDKLIEDNDIEALEHVVATSPSLGQQRKPPKLFKRSRADNKRVNGDTAAYDDLWPLPEAIDATKVDRQRVLFLLSKIFSYAPDEPQVEVRIASRKLLEWLTLTGYLTRTSLEEALRPNDASTQREPIHPGDLMSAISEVDDEYQLMHGLLSLPAPWELAEVVQAMCLLIQSFDATPESGEQGEAQLALPEAPTTNGTDGVPNGDVAMVNGDANSHVESESKAAETELEHAERILLSGLEVRSDTLRVILERLHMFPARDVTKTMRAMMTQKELIFLMHMLRIELADGGWTSKYVGGGADEERYEGNSDPLLVSMVDIIPGDAETGPSNQAIRAIGDLLNCAIDAVGTSGWLVGLSGDAMGTEELLDSLRAEVSAGLEGCYEANTLDTFLGELDRFVASKPPPTWNGNTGVVEEEEVLDVALPVGGRMESAVNAGKQRGGKKSKHLTALEKSKKVGKYSFDRIRI